jgi:hypothetical protein
MPKRIFAGAVGIVALVACFFASVYAIEAVQDAYSSDFAAAPWWAIVGELVIFDGSEHTRNMITVSGLCLDRSQPWRWRALAQAAPFGLWTVLSRFCCFIRGGTQLGLPHLSRESRSKRTAWQEF